MKCPVCYLENDEGTEKCERCSYELGLQGENVKYFKKQYKRKNANELGLVGFVLGLLSIPFSKSIILPVLAIILSSISLKKKKNENWQGNAGLVLGIIFLIFGIVSIFLAYSRQ